MKFIAIVATSLLALTLTGCSQTTAEPALPIVKVTKSPTCGCCKIWVDRQRQAGIQVEVNDVVNKSPG